MNGSYFFCNHSKTCIRDYESGFIKYKYFLSKWHLKVGNEHDI